MTSLGDRLKIARERKGYTQVYVRDKTRINNKTLSGYEKGVSEPDTKTISVLADLYEVSYRWLLTGKGSIDSSVANTENDEFEYYRQKIITEFPNIDLMFKEMSTLTAEDLKDVYEYIKFKQSQHD